MISLKRFAFDPVQGVIGELYAGHITLYTQEDPWRENESGRSCIPEGIYAISRDLDGKHRVYRIKDVPGRSSIEFHAGNTAEDTRGCILLGTGYKLEPGNWRITDSADAVARFLHEMDDRSSQIWIRS